uniref:Uncharacterized protein n=2 Tax=Bursaphelenchus xylophilus TaxID=6326 RepID=A0A1I7S310_BURXY
MGMPSIGLACIGGFGGGGQSCCPPHSGPICGSSAPSCGGGYGSSYSAPQYAAPPPANYNPPQIAYPAAPQPQPLPAPPQGPSTYGSAYLSVPLPPQDSYQQQPGHYINSNNHPHGPSGGNYNIPSNFSPPGHVPPSVGVGKATYSSYKNAHVKIGDENSHMIHEPFGNVEEEEKDISNGRQKQVEGSKKHQETNSEPTDEDKSKKPEKDEGPIEITESSISAVSRPDASVREYGEEEHSTGYKFKS